MTGALRRDHPLWRAAYRPLFLCAGLWALLAPVVWLWPGGLGADPVGWHLHELIFGMGGAAVGGYLLTALPSWTGRGPISPQVVRALTILWLLARLVPLVSGHLPIVLLVAVALGYFGLLAAVLARQLLLARVWSGSWSVALVVAMALGNAAVLADEVGWGDAKAAPMAMVTFLAALIGTLGGRMVPAFARRWMLNAGDRRHLPDNGALAGLAAVATALAGGLILPGLDRVAGLGLLLAGLLQAVRLAGWLRARPWHYPALLMLYLAWVWVPVGMALLGVALLRPDVLLPGTALHALTMGAMGTMILAIAARPAMVRVGDRLQVGRGMAIAFALVWLATLLRLAAPLLPPDGPDPIIASAGLWMSGWAAYLWAFRPALTGAVPWPILSARRVDETAPPSPPQAEPPSDR